MEGHIVLNIFEWKGRWHWYVDRVYPAPRSRNARRVRLASDINHGEGYREPSQALDEAAAYLREVSRSLAGKPTA